MPRSLVLLLMMVLVFAQSAAGQDVDVAPLPATAERPRATIRLHTGPNLNLMSDWRDGLTVLQELARQNGLPITDESCICMSGGATALAHLTSRFAVGAQFEMLRDTRSFTVEDELRLLGRRASFGFSNETVVRTTQVLAAIYPRDGSHMHVQVGAGMGSGHTSLSTPGTDASGRAKGWLFTTSLGTEAKFWYVDAGWRFHRMRTTRTGAFDHDIDEARDVFHGEAEVQEFLGGREIDLTGAWVRLGLAFRFGRR